MDDPLQQISNPLIYLVMKPEDEVVRPRYICLWLDLDVGRDFAEERIHFARSTVRLIRTNY